jgi:threonine aldolase
VFLKPGLSRDFKWARKQGLQLASKMRYLAAQFDALLADDLWIANARQANRMAQLLSREAAKVPGVCIIHPTEANEVFASLPRAAIAPLQQLVWFYTWDETRDVVRWVASWDTTEGDVRVFLDALRKVMGSV